MTPSRRSRAAWIASVATLALVTSATVHALRVHREGARALIACDEALGKGERSLAIAEARVAAETTPFASSAEGLRRLEGIADEAAARGDDRTSLAAWRAFRGAVLATRGPAALRDKAEAKLAERGARLAEKERLSSPDARVTETSIRRDLAGEKTPSAPASLLLGIGAIAFLGGALMFLRPGASRDGAGARRLWLGASIAGAVLCVLGAAIP